jgi:hypothetical protein
MRDLGTLNEEMEAAGAWVFAAALHQPEASTVVRADGDGLLITDGPYAESKEFIGGFDVIQAADLDEALVWAGKLARVLGGLPVEVRPVAERF